MIGGKALTIPVKGIYFDQIKSGEKLEEYRLVTPYWMKRLNNRDYFAVVLTRGYPKAGGIEGETRLTRKWNGYIIKRITHPHFGPDAMMVFAIDVSHPHERRG
mgnify:CR=1 FL=1